MSDDREVFEDGDETRREEENVEEKEEEEEEREENGASKFVAVPLYTEDPIRYKPWNPSGAVRAIAFPVKPSLLPLGPNDRPKTYELGKHMGGNCSIELSMRFPEYPANDVSFDLSMREYRALRRDGAAAYTFEDCRECDGLNERVNKHNEFIAALLTQVLRQNGCKVNAGVVTQVGMPEESAVASYRRHVAAFIGDRYGTTVFAMEYLRAKADLLPMRDYDIPSAVELADGLSFFRAVAKRLSDETLPPAVPGDGDDGRRMIRVQFDGVPPVWWDGVTEHQTAGDLGELSWAVNDCHCAKFPLPLVCAGGSAYEYKNGFPGGIKAKPNAPCTLRGFVRETLPRYLSKDDGALQRAIRYLFGGANDGLVVFATASPTTEDLALEATAPAATEADERARWVLNDDSATPPV